MISGPVYSLLPNPNRVFNHRIIGTCTRKNIFPPQVMRAQAIVIITMRKILEKIFIRIKMKSYFSPPSTIHTLPSVSLSPDRSRVRATRCYMAGRIL